MQRRSKRFITLLIAAAIVFLIVNFLSPDALKRSWAGATAGMAQFVQETVPRYLRERLSIPENPVAKRERLLRELTQQIGAIERELEAVAPATGGAKPDAGRTPRAAAGTATAPTPPADQPTSPPAGAGGPLGEPGLRERIERTQELLARSEGVIEELERENPNHGLLAKAAERVLDRILPVPEGTDNAVCPQ